MFDKKENISMYISTSCLQSRSAGNIADAPTTALRFIPSIKASGDKQGTPTVDSVISSVSRALYRKYEKRLRTNALMAYEESLYYGMQCLNRVFDFSSLFGGMQSLFRGFQLASSVIAPSQVSGLFIRRSNSNFVQICKNTVQ
jgi:hypothetical protein